MVENFDQLLDLAKEAPRKRLGVIFPNNEETFKALCWAQSSGLVNLVLVGNEDLLGRQLGDWGESRVEIEIVPESNITGALRRSIELTREGKVDILMKGGVDTSTMMKVILQPEAGIRTGRLLSDIFVLEFPQRPVEKFVMITDGGMTLQPDLKNKVELIRNAVEVAHALGNPQPRVAILSATEFVLPNLQSTIDAAALSKMNDRGQIKGCIVDGPFALDCAISPSAADEKGIRSPVAGRAEILIAANIESANSLAKSTTYFAGLRLAHVIVGGKVPILIPSRSDSSEAKLLSIALGVIMSSVGNSGEE